MRQLPLLLPLLPLLLPLLLLPLLLLHAPGVEAKPETRAMGPSAARPRPGTGVEPLNSTAAGGVEEEVADDKPRRRKGKKAAKKSLAHCPFQASPKELAKFASGNSTSNILNRILSRYDPRIRPNFKKSPVSVNLNIFVNSFGSVQETTMDYRVNIFIRQKWNDPRLRLPADFQGSEALTVDPTMSRCLWRPDLFFANEKTANFHSVTKDNTLLFIYRNGDVLLSMRLSITLSCPMDLTLFPMDTQMCKMQLESFGFTTEDLRFNWAPGDPVQMDEMSLPQFDISNDDIRYGNCTKFYPGTGYYTCVEVIFTLRRQVGFYIMGVYAPTLLTVVLSWLSFWINPEASAARVPLGILSVLSLASQAMSLAAELPKVSYVKALDIWLIACLVFGFASLVEFAIVQVFVNSPKRVAAEKIRKERLAKIKKEQMEALGPRPTHGGGGGGGAPPPQLVGARPPGRCHGTTGAPRDLRGAQRGHGGAGLVGVHAEAAGRSGQRDPHSRRELRSGQREQWHIHYTVHYTVHYTAHHTVAAARRAFPSRSDLRAHDFSIVGSLPRDFDLTNYDCYGKPVGGALGPAGAGAGGNAAAGGAPKKPPPAKPIIPSEAKRVDHYARALFPLSFLFFNVVYWSVYL
uniref:Glycine receptor subunit beta-like n=1 Tax=Petromyzon marinus TaxID=7757 RepID=A0AAJ7SJK5_PETMA|nr:glycine receptor subunit beta-like [Petromyzon marinus]